MKKFLITILLVIVAASGVQAQVLENHFKLRSTSASMTNPALFASAQHLEFAAGLATKAATNSWNIALLRKYGNKDLDEEDKEMILRATNKDKFRVIGAGQPYVAVKYGQFGLRLNGQVHANGQLPSDVLELAFSGNELGREYKFEDANGEAAGYLETAAAVTFPLTDLFDQHHVTDLTLGLSAKYLSGIAFGQFTAKGMLKTSLTDDTALIAADGDAFYAHSSKGSGIAFDLGLSATISEQLKVDASILNVGSITWKDVNYGLASFETEIDLLDSDNAKFESDLTELGPGDDITWRLPRTFRLGGSYQLNKKTTFLGEVSFSKSEALGLTTRQAVGVEFLPLQFMPVQAVLAKRTNDPLRLDLGLGLEFQHFNLNLSLVNPVGLFRPQTQGFGIVLKSGVYF